MPTVGLDSAKTLCMENLSLCKILLCRWKTGTHEYRSQSHSKSEPELATTGQTRYQFEKEKQGQMSKISKKQQTNNSQSTNQGHQQEIRIKAEDNPDAGLVTEAGDHLAFPFSYVIP